MHGTNERPIFLQTRFEGAGHEFWADDGRTIYVTCNGGRQPQELWALDVKSGKESCVIAGPCVGHGTANAAQDRFFINNMYFDCKTGLWLAKKGSTTPSLLCQTGTDWHGKNQEHHPHPRFLPDGKTVSFTSDVWFPRGVPGGSMNVVSVAAAFPVVSKNTNCRCRCGCPVDQCAN